MKRLDLNLYKWIYTNHKQAVGITIILAIISALFAGSFIFIAWISKQILDIVIGAQEGDVTEYCILLVIIILSQILLNIIISYLKITAQTKIENKSREIILEKLYYTDYMMFQEYHSADYMTRLTSDVDLLADSVVGLLPEIVSILTQLTIGIVVLFLLDKKAAYFIILAGIIINIISRILGIRFRFLDRNVKRDRSQVRVSMDEFLENIVIIKSFQANKTIMNQVSNHQKQYAESRKKRNLISTLLSTGMYMIMAFGYYLIFIWGAYQVSSGAMTFGTLLAFLQIIEQIRTPLRGLSNIASKYDSMIVSAERLFEIEELKKEKRIEKHDKIEWHSIVLDHVDFSYGNKEVLSNISAVIKKGEMTVISGTSGIGKTTLFSLFLDLLKQQKGKIYFQTSNGNVLLDSYSRVEFAYVPHGNLLFHGSIRDNLLLANPNVMEEKIWEVLRVVCLEEAIMELPNGLDTELKKSGNGLSEGQKQRIAIARALLSNADILLLDESTSALDEMTEKQVWKNLKDMSDKTLICISHRPEAIRICDQEIKLS